VSRSYTTPRIPQTKRLGLALGLLVAILISRAAHAEPMAIDARAALAQAEKAFDDVDYGAMREAALRGLKAGRANVAETARLNTLAGMAAALLGNDEDARRHFLIALGIQPTLDLERDLSPKIRGPYLEALGYWGTHRERLTLHIHPDARMTCLTYQLVDPAHLGTRIKVFVRTHGTTEFSAQPVAANGRGRIELAPAAANRGFDYFAEVVDEHDNRLVEVGNEDDPLTQQGRSDSSIGALPASARSSERRPGNSRSVALPLSLMVGGLAAAAVGGYFNVRRQDAAERWNSSACEQPGRTRLEQCGNVNSERATMERLSIGLYVAGGALVAAGTTLLFWGGGAESTGNQTPKQSQWSCGATVLVPSIACQGQF